MSRRPCPTGPSLAGPVLLALLAGWPARAQDPGSSKPGPLSEEALPAEALPAENLPEGALPGEPLPEEPTGVATGAEAAWTVGLPVAQVSLEAPEGGLPRESLDPLLRVSQGETLDLRLIRQDIALLMRAGAFRAVEVDAEPWLAFDEEGEPVDAVHITYRVYPAPRVGRVELEGVTREQARLLRKVHGLDRGEPFFPRRDGPATARRIEEAMVADGWPMARARVHAERVEDDELIVHIQVEPGTPRVLEQVVLAGGLPLERRSVIRALRKLGFREGERLPTARVREARSAVRDLLVAQGYLDPRVTLLFTTVGDGVERLAILGEAGPRTEVVATGPGAPPPDRLAGIIGLQPGTRVSEGMVEDSVEAVHRWLQGRGYYVASVTPRLQRSGDDALLVLSVDRGPRHRLAAVDVDGAETLGTDTVRQALREAAPESLGHRVVVDEDLASAERALQELYRGRGRLGAKVRVDPPTAGPPRWAPPFGRVVPLRLTVEVDEGPETVLAGAELEGGDGPVRMQFDAGVQAMVGGAYLPGRLEGLRQLLVEGLRARGYLDADARVETQVADGAAEARFVVTPGEQVRLRSITIQGNVRTRRAVIDRELAVVVGKPITPEALELTRRRLYDLDLFRVVTLELIGEDPRSRDLIVRVEERPSVLVQVGGGVATDRGIAARGRLANRNLGGRGQSLSMVGEAGYRWLGESFLLDLGAPVWEAGLRYEAPYLPGRGQRLVAELTLNETLQETTYRVYDARTAVGLRVRLGERDEAYVGYGISWRRLDDIDPGALVVGDPWVAALGMQGPEDELPAVLDARRFLSGPRLALVLDQRDDPLDPRRGWRMSALFDFDDSLVQGLAGESIPRIRSEARVEQLVGMGPLVLALGAQGGIGWAAGGSTTLAVEDRFVLGGSGSLRGFRPGTVGPANEEARPDIDMPEEIDPLVRWGSLAEEPTHLVPTGGDSMAAGTIELRAPLSLLGFDSLDDTFLVGFTDVGRVAFLDPDVQPTSRVEGLDPAVRVGLGGGLRVASPVGPVALLLGVNPAPIEARGERSLSFYFTLGDL